MKTSKTTEAPRHKGNTEVSVFSPCLCASVVGLTLVELLVAFMIFIMMIGALVSLTSRSLDTWQQGEKRKAVYDRAQVVLDMIARDIRNTYSENEIFTDGRKQLLPAIFACDYDAHRRQRIRFVRTGNPAVMRAPGGGGGGGGTQWILPQTEYTDLFEVAYILDPEEKNAVLLRGTRRFDRNTQYTLMDPRKYERPGQRALGDYFEAVESGVLHVGYRFWTQVTTTWDDSYEVQRVSAKSRKPSGPERRWDSSRRNDRHFYYSHRRPDITNPDFVYPEIVQITVTIETVEPDLHNVRVAGSCEARNRVIELTHTDGLAEGPGMVLVGGEWVSYGSKTSTALLNCARGARRTRPSSHEPGTPVRYGETFTTEVRIAAYREAQEP